MLSSALVLVLSASSECIHQDAVRIQAHLLATEAKLRAHPPAGLTSQQLEARSRNLDHLHDYALQAVFPINDRFAAPTPFFIDARGTRCAMAALIEQEGGRDFVLRIARERNNARVMELVDEPELLSWLTANGMTADEAAEVQPTYFQCLAIRPLAVCTNNGKVAAQLTSTRFEDGGVYGDIERLQGGDGGLKVGQEVFVDLSYLLPDIVSVFPPGAEVYATFADDSPRYVASLALIGSDGGIFHVADRNCAVRPSVDWATATSLLGQPLATCDQSLEALDSSWMQPLCYRTNRVPSSCFADGGIDPAVVMMQDGGMVPPGLDAGGPAHPSDAGTAATPGGLADSGTPAPNDAGTGSNDAGTQPSTPGGGPITTDPDRRYGCSSTDGTTLVFLGLLACTALLHRRRRG